MQMAKALAASATLAASAALAVIRSFRRSLPAGRVARIGRDHARAPVAAGSGIRMSNLARCTLKNVFTLRTFASCVNSRCTSAW